MIQREALIHKYNPILSGIDIHSPLTVGNGNFAFTADITGLQTLYDRYADGCPVLTMSSWGYHTKPAASGSFYSPEDLETTEYTFNNRKVSYPTTETERNSEIYNWLRENPHRMNLARVRLTIDNRVLGETEIGNPRQELDLYTGILYSRFLVRNTEVNVTTLVANSDTLAVKIDSRLCGKCLGVKIDFPYPSCNITGSDFHNLKNHETTLYRNNEIKRTIDKDRYFCKISGNVFTTQSSLDEVNLEPSGQGNEISFTVSFAPERDSLGEISFKQAFEETRFRYYSFWNKGAMVDVTSSSDERAGILQKRIITSMYLCAVQDASNVPPTETGLTCNSWYGKFHLEMHPVHQAFLPLFGRGEMLEKSLEWYIDTLPVALNNAKINGYKGARWTKMTDPSGINSPSAIAPLLVWQQPHVIYMLSLLYLSRYEESRVEVPLESEEEFLKKYRDVIINTAEFMADFPVYNKEKDCYDLLPPMFSVQEKGDPLKIKNPPFETAYFAFGLRKAYELMEKLGEKYPKWLEVSEKMAKAFVNKGLFEAYEGYEETFEKLNIDHPSMIFAYGMFSHDTDVDVLNKTVDKVLEKWDFSTLWGWDFAFMAMTLARLGRMEEAFDVLLMDTAKNTYVESGNNAQLLRNDLPLYLPGNGSLLLAMTVLKNCNGWYVQTEGLMNYPF